MQVSLSSSMEHPKKPCLAQRALDVFGVQAQLAQAQEELAELIVAISHLRRGRTGHALALRDEIADVEFMLEQLRLVWPDPDPGSFRPPTTVRALAALICILDVRLDVGDALSNVSIRRAIADVELGLVDVLLPIDAEDPDAMDRTRERKRAKALLAIESAERVRGEAPTTTPH